MIGQSYQHWFVLPLKPMKPMMITVTDYWLLDNNFDFDRNLKCCETDLGRWKLVGLSRLTHKRRRWWKGFRTMMERMGKWCHSIQMKHFFLLIFLGNPKQPLNTASLAEDLHRPYIHNIIASLHWLFPASKGLSQTAFCSSYILYYYSRIASLPVTLCVGSETWTLMTHMTCRNKSDIVSELALLGPRLPVVLIIVPRHAAGTLVELPARRRANSATDHRPTDIPTSPSKQNDPKRTTTTTTTTRRTIRLLAGDAVI